MVVVPVGIVICTVAGIGGGLVFLPVCMLMFDFTTQEAAPISIAMVFLNLLVRYLLCIPDRHPRRDKSVINYDIALIFSPGNIIGTIFGLLINTVSASWLILIFIVILMAVNAFFTAKKALELKNKTKNEKKSKRINLSEEALIYLDKLKDAERKIKEGGNNNNVQPLLTSSDDEFIQPNINRGGLDQARIKFETSSLFAHKLPLENGGGPEQPPVPIHVIEETRNNLEKILAKERRYLDYEKVTLLLLNLVVLVILNLFKGSSNTNSIVGFEYCGTGFWVFQFLYIPFGILFLYLFMLLLSREHKQKMDAGYVFLKGDLIWDKSTCIKIFINGIVVGFISSLLGIGGAVVSAPVLLKLGVETQEASFTASFMALYSAISSTIQYLINGQIHWDYAGFYGGICLVGMFIGLKVILMYLKKKNLLYGIVYLLVVMIFLATALNIFSNVRELVNDEESRHFRAYC